MDSIEWRVLRDVSVRYASKDPSSSCSNKSRVRSTLIQTDSTFFQHTRAESSAVTPGPTARTSCKVISDNRCTATSPHAGQRLPVSLIHLADRHRCLLQSRDRFPGGVPAARHTRHRATERRCSPAHALPVPVRTPGRRRRGRSISDCGLRLTAGKTRHNYCLRLRDQPPCVRVEHRRYTYGICPSGRLAAAFAAAGTAPRSSKTHIPHLPRLPAGNGGPGRWVVHRSACRCTRGCAPTGVRNSSSRSTHSRPAGCLGCSPRSSAPVPRTGHAPDPRSAESKSSRDFREYREAFTDLSRYESPSKDQLCSPATR